MAPRRLRGARLLRGHRRGARTFALLAADRQETGRSRLSTSDGAPHRWPTAVAKRLSQWSRESRSPPHDVPTRTFQDQPHSGHELPPPWTPPAERRQPLRKLRAPRDVQDALPIALQVPQEEPVQRASVVARPADVEQPNDLPWRVLEKVVASVASTSCSDDARLIGGPLERPRGRMVASRSRWSEYTSLSVLIGSLPAGEFWPGSR